MLPFYKFTLIFEGKKKAEKSWQIVFFSWSQLDNLIRGLLGYIFHYWRGAGTLRTLYIW